MSDGPDPLTPEQRQKKREGLLEMDYADTCDNCDEIYFEWQDECRYCESADGVEETSEQQTLLTDGGTSASAIQQTLAGDVLEISRIVCENYEGCTAEVSHVVENLGGNAYLDSIDKIHVCDSCADEWREGFSTVRMATVSERWEAKNV